MQISEQPENKSRSLMLIFDMLTFLKMVIINR